MKKFTAFKIYSIPFYPDLISGLLWELDISGITEEENNLVAYTTLHSKIDEEDFVDLLTKLKAQNIIESFSVSSQIQEDKNWNELWENSREVIRVSDRIVIKPTFKSYKQKNDDIVITIDPKMSFGTGEHQTTSSIIRLLEKYIKPEMKILDVGSGTGILAISALKLGASYAVAVDNDGVCFENCLENSELNSVEDRIKIINGTVTDVTDEEFDIVVANIQQNVLIEIAEQITKKVKLNSIVILSGLLDEDEFDVLNLYKSFGFNHVETYVKDEWIALVLISHIAC